MSHLAMAARQRDCGVLVRVALICRVEAWVRPSGLPSAGRHSDAQGVLTAFIVVSKECALGVEQCPANGIDRHDGGEEKQNKVPVAGSGDEPTGGDREQGGAHVAEHVHRAEDRRNVSTAKADSHGITADSAECRAEGAQGDEGDALVHVADEVRADD